MCEQAGLKHCTNHSLRATAATDMFKAYSELNRTPITKSIEDIRESIGGPAKEACKVLTPITSNCHQEPKKHEQAVGNVQPPQMVTNALFGNHSS